MGTHLGGGLGGVSGDGGGGDGGGAHGNTSEKEPSAKSNCQLAETASIMPGDVLAL